MAYTPFSAGERPRSTGRLNLGDQLPDLRATNGRRNLTSLNRLNYGGKCKADQW